MRRRELLTGAACGLIARGAIRSGMRLIAHRGGVVDKHRHENSAESIRAAIERGYWMVEVDVRRTRDGEPVLHHDSTFSRYYGETRRPEEMSWKEIKVLRAPGGGKVIHFETACEMCRDRMRLMLDLKGSDWPKEFYGRLLRAIDAARVPGPVWSLGGARVKPLFDGRVVVSANRRDLRRWADEGQPVSRDYFLFELGSELDQEAVALSRELKVSPVAAINTFRYTIANRDEWKGAAEDVERLVRLGVADFQVDSMYEPLFS